ncbi:hypothetical protein Psfp_03424 [Pelotomaculum sp. FP]|uniref:hypothetical protein n=1 Tax=Pelotomaculum sp. FP TaxID=261474 RepID=UPI0010658A3D|nr:hypothetical protein [Pelotomaculum sp. FP]TEB13560.1 hypothetical protein Psfp_03424 [Pelotomaculum sp. FP]
MSKMRGIIRSVKKSMSEKAVLAAGAATAVLTAASAAHAEPTTTVDYGTLFSGVVTEALKGITETLPIAIPILGVMAAVGLGMKVFKKLTGKA